MLLSVLIIILLSTLVPVNSRSETFDVSNQTEFQSALTTAQSNGEDDIINVAAGTINLTDSPLSYDGNESFSLTIQGAGASSTILVGAPLPLSGILRIEVSDPLGSVNIRDMTFKKGYYSPFNQVGALYVDGYGLIIERCVFTESEGGSQAVEVLNRGRADIINNIFSGNKGGGLKINGGSIDLMNNTFVRNVGGGN